MKHPTQEEEQIGEEGQPMEYLTHAEVMDWLHSESEDTIFCPYCLTALAQTDDGFWYCPNDMCLNDEQGKL